MNEPIRKSKTTKLTNLFAIICIIIVCYIGVVSSKQLAPTIYPTGQIPNQSGSNQAKSGSSNVIQKGGQTKQDATRMNPIPTRNSSVQNRTGGKPMGSLQTVPAVIVNVKGFSEGGLASIVSTKAWNMYHDTGFLILFRCENAAYDMNRKSYAKGANGKYDRGLCQVNEGYHPEIVNNPLFKTSMDWQIEQCYKLYKGGTPFYGPSRKKNGVKCSDKVKNDFIFVK